MKKIVIALALCSTVLFAFQNAQAKGSKKKATMAENTNETTSAPQGTLYDRVYNYVRVNGAGNAAAPGAQRDGITVSRGDFNIEAIDCYPLGLPRYRVVQIYHPFAQFVLSVNGELVLQGHTQLTDAQLASVKASAKYHLAKM